MPAWDSTIAGPAGAPDPTVATGVGSARGSRRRFFAASSRGDRDERAEQQLRPSPMRPAGRAAPGYASIPRRVIAAPPSTPDD